MDKVYAVHITLVDGGLYRTEVAYAGAATRLPEPYDPWATVALERAFSHIQESGEERVANWHIVASREGRPILIWVRTVPVIDEALLKAVAGLEFPSAVPAKAPGPGGTCDSAVVGSTTYFDERRDDWPVDTVDEYRARIARGEG